MTSRLFCFICIFVATHGVPLQFRTITFEEVKDMIKEPNTDSFYLIDVRRPQELINNGEIANTTINIPLGTLTKSLSLSDQDFQTLYDTKKPETSSKIVFTCSAGGRAAEAARRAFVLGFWNLFVYRGSFTEWKEKNGPLAHRLP